MIIGVHYGQSSRIVDLKLVHNGEHAVVGAQNGRRSGHQSVHGKLLIQLGTENDVADIIEIDLP